MNNRELKIKNNALAGFRLSRPYSKWRGGLFALLIRGALSAVSTLAVFYLIFKGFNIECDYILMTKIILIVSFIFTVLQLNTVVLAVSYVFAAFRLYHYISNNTEILKNGVMTMANQCYSIISGTLNLPAVDGFDNIMADTYLTVNSVSGIAAFIIAAVMVIVVVKLHSRLLYAMGISVVFAILSFFGCDIKYKYACILILGLVLNVVLSLGGVKGINLSIFSFIKKKGGKLNSDLIYVIQTAFIAFIIFIAVSQGFKFVYGIDKFESTFNDEYSENIKVTARDIAVMKYAEYKKFGFNKNVSLGQLGYISYVKPDFENSLFRVITEPITEGKMYIINFVGQDYHYRYNSWTEADDNNSVMVNALKNSGAAQKEYEIYSKDNSKFIPSYAENKEYTYNDENKAAITAYEYNDVEINDEEYNNYVNDTYLTIDDENKAVLDKICAEEGFYKEDTDIDAKIKDYFKNNYTYSTEVDVLPFGKDFVNYFIEESKTGNFTHYASAITLMYRSLGIPARYVSGYALEAEQTLAGKRVKKTNKTDITVKYANLYSWVEVYSSDGGWRIIDSVPAPSFQELEEKYGDDGDKSENTYTPDTSLSNYFKTIDREKYSPTNVVKTGVKAALRLILIALVILVIILFLSFGGVFVYNMILYIRSDNSQKAYILMERIKKRFKINSTSYRDMENALTKKYGSKRAVEIIELGEKCIFSRKVTDEDIKRLKKLIGK